MHRYTAQLSLAAGAAALLSLVVVMGGGRKRRATAWPLCAGFVAAHGVFQIITMGWLFTMYQLLQGADFKFVAKQL